MRFSKIGIFASDRPDPDMRERGFVAPERRRPKGTDLWSGSIDLGGLTWSGYARKQPI